MSFPKLKPASTFASVASLTINPGEYVAIYLRGATGLHQVEAHVTEDGTPRVLVRRDSEIVARFDDVYGAIEES